MGKEDVPDPVKLEVEVGYGSSTGTSSYGGVGVIPLLRRRHPPRGACVTLRVVVFVRPLPEAGLEAFFFPSKVPG